MDVSTDDDTGLARPSTSSETENKNQAGNPFVIKDMNFVLDSPLLDDTLQNLKDVVTDIRMGRKRKADLASETTSSFRKTHPDYIWTNKMNNTEFANLISKFMKGEKSFSFRSDLVKKIHKYRNYMEKRLNTKRNTNLLESKLSLILNDDVFVTIDEIFRNFSTTIGLDECDTNDYNDITKIKNKICEEMKTNVYLQKITICKEFYSLMVNIKNSNTLDDMMASNNRFHFKMKIRSSDNVKNVLFVEIDGLKFLLNQQFFADVDSDLVITSDMLLMLKDIYQNRWNTLIACIIYPEVGKLGNVMRKMYDAGDEIIMKLGTDGYDIIKFIEPFCNYCMTRGREKVNVPNSKLAGFEKFIEVTVNEFKQNNQNASFIINKFFNTVMECESPWETAFIFGCYRHWGHPIIEVEQGLNKLHEQVNMDKDIDPDLSKQLGANMLTKLIRKFFNTNGKWPISDTSTLQTSFPFYQNIIDSSWPTKKQLQMYSQQLFEVEWDPMFKIPETMPLSEMTDDKTHSLGRRELKTSIRDTGTIGDPLSRKLINTVLHTNLPTISSFLKGVDEHGLDKNDKIIGLRPKEREMKKVGRFFSLMSLNLRQYFVFTEYLIAEFILPLFDSITMTDDLNKVYKKMMESIPGHGDGYPSKTTVVHHIDYEKWNNHMRHESTYWVFKAIDLSFGFKDVVSRTHKILQECAIYYAGKPDMIDFDNDLNISSKDENVMYAWEGQKGGLEGIRQKGWSILSLLIIENILGKRKNISSKVLAQGDNQVISLTFIPTVPKDHPYREKEESNILDIAFNILGQISRESKSLGLIIKLDETWSSTNYMIYGKNMLLGRNVICPISKRVARIDSVDNNQILSIKNVLSSISTTSLTLCQSYHTVFVPIISYLIYGSIYISDFIIYNPVIENKIDINSGEFPELVVKMLFADTCMGGVGGLSLTRFLIRQFPDPVTESLSFYLRMINMSKNERTIKILKDIAEVVYSESMNYSMLIESPTSLNIKGSTSCDSMIKSLIKEELVSKADDWENEEISSVLKVSRDYDEIFVSYLMDTEPVFPRFNSELYAASIYGVANSITGLFQSSRTIRLIFKRTLSDNLHSKSIAHEVEIINILLKDKKSNPWEAPWKCSSDQADRLRKESWCKDIVGVTVPHPYEYMNISPRMFIDVSTPMMVSFVDNKISHNLDRSGIQQPYMGSSTSATTTIYKNKMRDSMFSLIKRPLSLLSSINWFVSKDSKLCETIIANLSSFTNIDFSTEFDNAVHRTGSALHRFKSSRYSNGGFVATSHNLLTYCFTTTDYMYSITRDSQNWDFMFQPTIIMTQLIAVNKALYNRDTSLHLFEWGCPKCLRPVESINLTNRRSFRHFPRVSRLLQKYLPKDENQIVNHDRISFPFIDIESVDEISVDYSVGLWQAFISSLVMLKKIPHTSSSMLYPKSISNKIDPANYLKGFVFGLVAGGSLAIIKNLQLNTTKKDHSSMQELYLNYIMSLLNKIVRIDEMVTAFSSLNLFTKILQSVESETIKRFVYPISRDNVLKCLNAHLFTLIKNPSFLSRQLDYARNMRQIVLFSEVQDNTLINQFKLAVWVMNTCCKSTNLPLDQLRSTVKSARTFLKEIYDLRNVNESTSVSIPSVLKNCYRTDSELRHAVKLSGGIRPGGPIRMAVDDTNNQFFFELGPEYSKPTERFIRTSVVVNCPNFSRWNNYLTSQMQLGMKLLKTIGDTVNIYVDADELICAMGPNLLILQDDDAKATICMARLESIKAILTQVNIIKRTMNTGGYVSDIRTVFVGSLKENEEAKVINYQELDLFPQTAQRTTIEKYVYENLKYKYDSVIIWTNMEELTKTIETYGVGTRENTTVFVRYHKIVPVLLFNIQSIASKYGMTIYWNPLYHIMFQAVLINKQKGLNRILDVKEENVVNRLYLMINDYSMIGVRVDKLIEVIYDEFVDYEYKSDVILHDVFKKIAIESLNPIIRLYNILSKLIYLILYRDAASKDSVTFINHRDIANIRCIIYLVDSVERCNEEFYNMITRLNDLCQRDLVVSQTVVTKDSHCELSVSVGIVENHHTIVGYGNHSMALFSKLFGCLNLSVLSNSEPPKSELFILSELSGTLREFIKDVINEMR